MQLAPGRPCLVLALTVAVVLASLAPDASLAGPVAGAAQVAPPCSTPMPGDHPLTLVSDGRTRTALLHVASAPAGQALPLVIAFHGAGGNGPEFAEDSGLSTAGDHDGFDVVYPTSLGPEWSISKTERDVDFAGSLINQVESMACVDPRRVSATGVSIGAGMAARVGCELSARIAGLVLVSGGYKSLLACSPDRPVSVLEIHGTSDPTVPYRGEGPNHIGAVLPYVIGWAARDHCNLTPKKTVVAAHTLLYAWSGCASGTSVQHLRIYGGGHGLPNAQGFKISAGRASPISGVNNIWHFLASRTLAQPFAG